MEDKWKLTARWCFWTMSTASWLVKCSHRPSEANMTKRSHGWRLWDKIDGLALNKGLLNGVRSLNFVVSGSMLYRGSFKNASPIDLDNCIIDHCVSTEYMQFKYRDRKLKIKIRPTWKMPFTLQTLCLKTTISGSSGCSAMSSFLALS